jgi:putative ABC transport system permease protein
MVAVVLASLNERRRELAILRSVGAGPRHIAALLVTESLVVTLAGIMTGMLLLALLAVVGAPWAQARFGVALHPGVGSWEEWRLLGLVVLAALLAGGIPAWRACRLALADGLSPKL